MDAQSRCKRPMQRARLWRRREEKRDWISKVISNCSNILLLPLFLRCRNFFEGRPRLWWYKRIILRFHRDSNIEIKTIETKIFHRYDTKACYNWFYMGRIGMGKVGKPKGTMSESRSGWIESLIFHERWAWPCVIPYNSESNDVASGSSTRL